MHPIRGKECLRKQNTENRILAFAGNKECLLRIQKYGWNSTRIQKCLRKYVP